MRIGGRLIQELGRLGRGWVVLACALLAALTLRHLPLNLRGLWDQARSGSEVSDTARLLAPTPISHIQHPEIFAGAARVMPTTARYAVLVGPGAERADAGYRRAVPFAVYWLLPRRRVDAAARGDWVLGYGIAPRELEFGHGRVISLAPGIIIVRRTG